MPISWIEVTEIGGPVSSHTIAILCGAAPVELGYDELPTSLITGGPTGEHGWRNLGELLPRTVRRPFSAALLSEMTMREMPG